MGNTKPGDIINRQRDIIWESHLCLVKKSLGVVLYIRSDLPVPTLSSPPNVSATWRDS